MARMKLKAFYELFGSEGYDSELSQRVVENGYIPIDKEIEVVNNVVDNCFDKFGRYNHTYFEYALFVNVLYYYYNIKHNQEKCITDMLYGHGYDGCKIRNEIYKHIDSNQFMNIRDSALRNIHHMCALNIRYAELPSEDLLQKVGAFVDNINDIVESYASTAKLDDKSTADIIERLSSIINSTGSLNEQSIVNAIIDTRFGDDQSDGDTTGGV